MAALDMDQVFPPRFRDSPLKLIAAIHAKTVLTALVPPAQQPVEKMRPQESGDSYVPAWYRELGAGWQT